MRRLRHRRNPLRGGMYVSGIHPSEIVSRVEDILHDLRKIDRMSVKEVQVVTTEWVELSSAVEVMLTEQEISAREEER